MHLTVIELLNLELVVNNQSSFENIEPNSLLYKHQ